MSRPKTLLRRTCRLVLYLTVIWVVLEALLAAAEYIPIRISTNHEEAYFAELDRVQKIARGWRSYPWENKTETEEWRRISRTPPEIPYNERLLPLVHDVVQLRSSSFIAQLGLYANLTAPYPMQKTWVYIGGTPSELEPWWKRTLRHFTIATLPGPSCKDPAYICNAFNDGFNRLIEYYHTHRQRPYVEFGSALAFVDCDNSPFICDFLQMDPPVLLYLETKGPCEYHLPNFSMLCGTKWQFVPLPLNKMPFKRMQSLDSGIEVPVFPSAFEQLHSMVSFAGTADLMDLEEDLVWDISVDHAVILDGPILTIDDLGLCCAQPPDRWPLTTSCCATEPCEPTGPCDRRACNCQEHASGNLKWCTNFRKGEWKRFVV